MYMITVVIHYVRKLLLKLWGRNLDRNAHLTDGIHFEGADTWQMVFRTA